MKQITLIIPAFIGIVYSSIISKSLDDFCPPTMQPICFKHVKPCPIKPRIVTFTTDCQIEIYPKRNSPKKVCRFQNHLEEFERIQLKEIYVRKCFFNENVFEINSTFFSNLKSLGNSTMPPAPMFFENLYENLPKITKLRIQYNKLVNITEKYFDGMQQLNSLHLSRNSIRYIEDNAFNGLPELKKIHLGSNCLGSIGSELFRYNPEIEEIILSENSNLIISDFVFANLTKLTSIQIANCHLTEIPKHVFVNCINLNSVDLQMNEITHISQDLFKPLKNLKILNLNKNKLESLQETIFSSLENLGKLYLEYNELTNVTKHIFEGLGKLEYVTLKHNKIFSIDAEIFTYLPQLRNVDISFNKIECILLNLHHLDDLHKLALRRKHHYTIFEQLLLPKTLDISHNYLTKLPPFEFFVKLRAFYDIIDLSYNKIPSINLNDVAFGIKEADNINEPNSKTTKIKLSQNPFVCNCKNYDLVRYLTDTINSDIKTIVDIEVENTNCSEPDIFKNMSLENLLLTNIKMKYTDNDCPSSCICDICPYDSTIIIDCSYRNLTQVPDLKFEGKNIEISLIGNLLKMGPTESQGYKNVTKLFLSNNSLNSFTWCPPHIEELKLDDNNLNILNEDVLQILNKTSFLELTVANNPWTCDCSALDLQNFIKSYSNKINKHDVLCGEDDVLLSDRNLICKPTTSSTPQIVGPIILLLLIIIFSILATIYFKYKQEIKIWLFHKNWCLRFVSEEELDKDKKYDIFLCFSHLDDNFVCQNLIPSLEETFKLCIHIRDWIPGELINDQIVESIQNSRRTLVILSNSFLKSVWGKLEFLMAHNQSIEEGRPRVIVIKLGDLNEDTIDDDIKDYIKTYTYIEWGEPWFWKKLLYALPHYCKKNTNGNHVGLTQKPNEEFEFV